MVESIGLGDERSYLESLSIFQLHHSTLHGFAGLLIDLYLFGRVVITPSFAPGVYYAGRGKDLGFPLEFRSQVELSYRFLSGARIGVGVRWMWRPPGAATKPTRRASHIATGVSTIVVAPASTKGPKAGMRLVARWTTKARLKNASRKIACIQSMRFS